MKKLLLCTTALAGLVAGSAFAEDATNAMQVTVGGNSKFEAGSVSRDRQHKQSFSFSPNQESSSFYSSQKAYLKAEAKSDDLTYGAVIRLQTVANSSNGLGDNRNDRSHIYLDTNAGSVELGSNFSASKLLAVDAGTIASGSGGASDGDASTFMDIREFGKNSNDSMLFKNADMLSDRLDGNVEGSRKISYFTPTISGLMAGVSFTPDLENNGGENDANNNNSTYLGNQLRVKNIWSLALKYSNNFDGVDLALSASTNIGKANKKNIPVSTTTTVPVYTSTEILDGNGDPTTSFYDKVTGTKDVTTTTKGAELEDLKTYAVGGVVGYNGFKFAVSYGSDGKSLAPKGSNFRSTWWTSGVAYESGPGSVSLTYLSGKKGNKSADETNSLMQVKTTAYSLGAAYEVAPGLKPFAEVTQVTFKPKKVVNGNTKAKATVYLVGTRIKF